MATQESKPQDRVEASAEGEYEVKRDFHAPKRHFSVASVDYKRKFRTVNRGFLVAGLLMTVIGLFLAPVTVRILCILINRGGYVQDTFEIEIYKGETSESYERIEGRILSSGERFTDQRTNLVGSERIRQLVAEGRITGYHLPVLYLPRRGVLAGMDRVMGVRMLSQPEFEMVHTVGVGLALFNIAIGLGGALLFRREIRRALKELRSRERR